MLTHKIDVRLIPFPVPTDFVKLTDFPVRVRVTLGVRNRDISFRPDNPPVH
jgi:hypothetical protein